jgi:alginate O-acetyltransferase complex protein AlgI
MVFSDPVFLFAFLPLCLILYWAVAWRSRNSFLTAVGCVFYLAGAGGSLLLLVGTILLNYGISVLIRKRQNAGNSTRLTLMLGVSLNVASLAVWKYSGFAAEILSDLIGLFGGQSTFTLKLLLPIAISFYTFQCISYLVDVFHREIEQLPSLRDFAAYIFLFPHLIAGPIVRYRDIEHELLSRPTNRLRAFSFGAPRFFWGLAKKILIADQISVIADRVFALPDNRLSFLVAWIGVVIYALQIYFDFSGYSDMAIGLAQMFGFRFKENFNRPYSATSVTDFWRRWHISLSSWFRDYVYIPLGGNRSKRKSRTYINLVIVFVLTGFWHGAQWTFMAWGLFHGFFLVVERFARERKSSKAKVAWPAAQRFLTFIVVCFGWALFRSTSISQAGNFFSTMVRPTSWEIPLVVDEVLTAQRITWIVVGLLVLLVPQKIQFGLLISESDSRRANALRLGTILFLAPLACVYALTTTFSPFLYFQF